MAAAPLREPPYLNHGKEGSALALELAAVQEKFSRYSGETPSADDSRGKLCAELCAECAARADALAENGRSPTETEALALESWAAAEAFYQLVLLDEALAPESLSADGVRVDLGARSQKARALAEEKRRGLASLLGEGAFYFGRV